MRQGQNMPLHAVFIFCYSQIHFMPKVRPPRTAATSRARIIKKNFRKFTGSEIVDLIENALKSKHPARMLLARGLDSRGLYVRCFQPHGLVARGFSVSDLRELGFTADELLRDIPYLNKVTGLKAAGFTSRETYGANSFSPRLRKSADKSYELTLGRGYASLPGRSSFGRSNFTVSKLKDIGYSAHQLIAEGFSQNEVNAAFSKKRKK